MPRNLKLLGTNRTYHNNFLPAERPRAVPDISAIFLLFLLCLHFFHLEPWLFVLFYRQVFLSSKILISYNQKLFFDIFHFSKLQNILNWELQISKYCFYCIRSSQGKRYIKYDCMNKLCHRDSSVQGYFIHLIAIN